jgi:hypothetical protein
VQWKISLGRGRRERGQASLHATAIPLTVPSASSSPSGVWASPTHVKSTHHVDPGAVAIQWHHVQNIFNINIKCTLNPQNNLFIPSNFHLKQLKVRRRKTPLSLAGQVVETDSMPVFCRVEGALSLVASCQHHVRHQYPARSYTSTHAHTKNHSN